MCLERSKYGLESIETLNSIDYSFCDEIQFKITFWASYDDNGVYMRKITI